MARVAIIGFGAIGATLAAHFQRDGGHDVVICARRDPGMVTVHAPEGEFSLTAPLLTDAEQASPVDWILVATKATHNAALTPWLERLIGPQTRLAVLQNGVGHRERFATWLPGERLVPVVVFCPVERPSPTQVYQRAPLRLSVPNDPASRDFATLLAGVAAEVRLSDDFLSTSWQKLALNCAGIRGAIRREPAKIFHEPAVATEILGLVSEAIAVGEACGATFPPDYAAKVLRICQASDPEAIDSLQADVRAGRPTELTYRNGAVVAFGKQHSVPTPLNTAACEILTANSPS